jgi:phosphatidylethanolamine/phosphatidyl-N-methylethanolamine N-methyltransferase
MRSLESHTHAHESKLYYEFSHFYDFLFGRLFYPRIVSLIRSLAIQPGARVLELGVGTGLSLSAYPDHCQVVGVDLAPDMLEHAQERIMRNGWRHITVKEMNAMDLNLPDSSFDFVTAFHVVSVVPDARRLMQEAQRVCKPGGTIAVINHFRSEKTVLAAADRCIEPLTRRCGWHTLGRADVLDGLPLRIEKAYKTSPYSLFTILILDNDKPPVLQAAEGAADTVQ